MDYYYSVKVILSRKTSLGWFFATGHYNHLDPYLNSTNVLFVS